MDIKYDVPAPPDGALERTINLGQKKMRSTRCAKMPLGRLLGLQLAHFSPLYWTVQLVVIVCIILNTGSGKESARFAVLVYAGAANTLGCPELLRDISCSMSEIERSCRISGAKLLAVRMLIIACADLLGLTLTAAIVSSKFGTELAQPLITGAALLFSSSFLTLLALRLLPFVRSRAGALSLSLVISAALGIVCLSVVWSTGVWALACAVSLVLLAAQTWRELSGIESRKGKSIWNYL